MAALFKDMKLATKEYYSKPKKIPDEERLTVQLGLEHEKTEEDLRREEEEKEQGMVPAADVLNDKIVGLYFSAGWCPPCQLFTPMLCDLYLELKNRSASFEVVFVSFDKKEEDMISYYKEKHCDWFAVPFGIPKIEELREKFGITAVPKLVIVNKDGEIITQKGRKEIQDKGVICYRNWEQIATTLESKTSQVQDEDADQSKEVTEGKIETAGDKTKSKLETTGDKAKNKFYILFQCKHSTFLLFVPADKIRIQNVNL
ncbi:hypothetical protein ACJMK2_041427 [Sinanodonta woodiana]|uniref:Thioredoxin domain-containing protein n=1 Tax=Sinanodonta woodiana TaxID=1069815 RepID=A0ABD3W456_SINWO